MSIYGLKPRMGNYSAEGASSVAATLRRQRQLGRELGRRLNAVAREPVPGEMLLLLAATDHAASAEAEAAKVAPPNTVRSPQ